jgi:hypothetical protein
MGTYEDLPAELTTERLRLRRWLPSDAEEYRGLWVERDPRAVRRIDAEGRPTVEDIRGRIVHNPLAAERGLGLLPIERRDTGEFIGYCGLTVGRGLSTNLRSRMSLHGELTVTAMPQRPRVRSSKPRLGRDGGGCGRPCGSGMRRRSACSRSSISTGVIASPRIPSAAIRSG